jgi:hypothetical protein
LPGFAPEPFRQNEVNGGQLNRPMHNADKIRMDPFKAFQ